MATFHYRAYGARGELSEGTIEANSTDDVLKILLEKRLAVLEVRPVAAAGRRWWTREPSSASRERVVMPLMRDLATLTGAGLPLDEALRIISNDSSAKQLRQYAAQLSHDLRRGASLAEAMSRSSDVFTPELMNVVAAGEMSGTLPKSLDSVAGLLERRAEIRSRINAALMYPVLLFALAIVSMIVLGAVFVPSVAPIFQDSGKPLPYLLSLAVTLSERWSEIGIVCLSACIVVLILLRSMSQTSPLRGKVHKALLRLPVIGGLIADREAARFSRTLATLLRAGVPLLTGLATARSAVGNIYLSNLLSQVEARVREGSALHDALLRDRPLPETVIRLVSVGEHAGTLEAMLEHAAAALESRLQKTLDTLVGLLSPVLTIAIAAAVGGLVLTVMSAVFDLNDAALR